MKENKGTMESVTLGRVPTAKEKIGGRLLLSRQVL